MKSKLGQIAEGWKNKLFPSKSLATIIEEVREKRLAVCGECEHHSKFHKTARPDDHCTQCGCTLAAKTSCLTCECPLKKWIAEMNEEQLLKLKKDEREKGSNK